MPTYKQLQKIFWDYCENTEFMNSWSDFDYFIISLYKMRSY